MPVIATATTEKAPESGATSIEEMIFVTRMLTGEERPVTDALDFIQRAESHVKAWSEIDGVGLFKSTPARMAAIFEWRKREGDGRIVFAIDPQAASARALRAVMLEGKRHAMSPAMRLEEGTMEAGNPWKGRQVEFAPMHDAWEDGYHEGLGEIAGIAAFSAGKVREANPNTRGTPAWKGWDAGWEYSAIRAAADSA